MYKYLLVVFLLGVGSHCQAQLPFDLLTVPEKTNYDSTSKSVDVVAYVEAIQKHSPYVHVEKMFTTKAGRPSPVVIMARPKISSPKEAVASGKPIIYFQGNIHGGEVEGKEALMLLMREILLGNRKHLLNNQILIFAPNYNPDGNDNLSSTHRRSQAHCPFLVGARRSGGDFDLNRDGIKLEAVETRGLMKNILQRWDPDLLVDMHTTNGTWHGNELTYAHSYHYAGHAATSDFTEQQLLPTVKKAMLDKYDLHCSIYGNYHFRDGWPPKSFYTYNHHPRYLINQMGLRNRMAILSETFAHDNFYQRIHSAHKFAVEILAFTNAHGKQIQAINQEAEEATIKEIKENAGKIQRGVRFKMVPKAQPFRLRTYDYQAYTDTNNSVQYARLPTIIEVEGVQNYSAFESTVKATVPRGYIIPARFQKVVDKLKAHGVFVEKMKQAATFSGEVFMVDKLKVAAYKFEHHHLVTLAGEFQEETKKFKVGDYKILLTQPLANLIFYMLEPQSDDGFATWNFFDKYFNEMEVNERKVAYPIFKFW